MKGEEREGELEVAYSVLGSSLICGHQNKSSNKKKIIKNRNRNICMHVCNNTILWQKDRNNLTIINDLTNLKQWNILWYKIKLKSWYKIQYGWTSKSWAESKISKRKLNWSMITTILKIQTRSFHRDKYNEDWPTKCKTFEFASNSLKVSYKYRLMHWVEKYVCNHSA